MRKKLSVVKRMLAFVLTFAMAFTAISWRDVGEVMADEGEKSFTLYYYCEDEDVEKLYMNIWNHTGLEFAAGVTKDTSWEWKNPQGIFQSVDQKENWYSIDLTITPNQNDGFDIYKNDGNTNIGKYDNQWNNTDAYAILVGGTSETYAMKDGKVYTSIEEAEGITTSSAVENYITNGTFESAEDLTGWKLTSNLKDQSETLELGTATNCGITSGNAAYVVNNGSQGSDTFLTTTISTLPAGTYKFTAYVMGNGFTEAYPVIDGAAKWGDDNKVTSPGWKGATDEWSKVQYKFTIEESTDDFVVGLYMWTLSKESNPDWSCIDDVSLVPVNEEEVTYDLSVSASKKSYITVGDTVTLTANMTCSNESQVELGEDCKLEWVVNDTLGGLTDAEFVNEEVINAGNQSKVQVKLPSKGVYYFTATLKSADDKELARYTIKLSTEDIENVYVEKLDLENDFIKGVDISSLEAELESGVKFYDFNGNVLDEAGFFEFLKECGINWVRIRVWNDPTDGNGNGYGGGNCDLTKAISMGKYATDAGLKVLIDFHYSDTWADPSRQLAPKAWKELPVDKRITEIEKYTKESVASLLSEGVDVGMVQIGNETTNTICDISENEGVDAGTAKKMQKMCEAFSAGSKGVREAAAAANKTIKVAIHIESPHKEGKYANYAAALDEFHVDYDVFASSYYPMWHGSLGNLNDVLSNIAKKYNKEVLVAETSWAYTYDDGDGWGNEDSEGKGYDQYEHSVQGQVNQLYDVTKTISETTGGIGVFYWEPAWIPVNYVYDDAGEFRQSAKDANVVAWETYGSGWATKACAEYDEEHVGEGGAWAGGSAVDNHAWFDWYGYPLASMKAFAYMASGNTTLEKVVRSVVANDLTVYLGDEVKTPSVSVRYNYGEDETISDVNWDQAAIEAACANGVGEYSITGNVTIAGKKYDVTFTLKIIKYNYLEKYNYSFEESGMWTITPNDPDKCRILGNDPHNGAKALKYDGELVEAGACQTIKLNKGIYTLGAYMQGNAQADGESYQIYVTVGNETKVADATPAGWYGDAGWQNPEIENIEIKSDNTSVTLGCKFTTTSSAWGTWDDFYLNKTGEVSDSGNGNGGSSSNTGSGAGSSSTPTSPADNKNDSTTTKNPDGTTTETKTETTTNESGKEVATTVTTKKDADGKVTGSTEVSTIAGAAKDTAVTVTVEKDAKGNVAEAAAEVTKKGTETEEGTKGTISAEVVQQIKEAAGSANVAITTSVTGADGKEKYSVTVDANDLVAGAKLTVVVKDAKTGKAVLVDAKQVKVTAKGNVSVVLPEGNDYTLIDAKEAAKVTKEILKTVAPAKTSATLKAGKTNTAKLSKKLDMDNVKKITYTTSKKGVVTVNKNGKVVAKKAGTATITIKVTLNNGKTKTVKMKYTVK
ncbi:MAG: glycosyl hydrolase 53 family protein [Lachnospiraceae bacterium]|nr:glycosyl hydrolase 53 family protein [bacterium]MDY5517038.1 glycosyl hydrolase 53 family protein [Lachnospiraceae bacterium]